MIAPGGREWVSEVPTMPQRHRDFRLLSAEVKTSRMSVARDP